MLHCAGLAVCPLRSVTNRQAPLLLKGSDLIAGIHQMLFPQHWYRVMMDWGLVLSHVLLPSGEGLYNQFFY